MGACSSVCLFSLLLLLSSTHGSKVMGKKVMAGRSMIGSRPPSCERRCMSCGHCEAIQVPAVPQEKRGTKLFFFKAISTSWRDDSNYKPMSWKCKCGDLILNP